jgi:hypothetical protein
MDGVTLERAKFLRLGFGAPPVYEIDGELRQAQHAELEVVTQAAVLEVLAPARDQ